MVGDGETQELLGEPKRNLPAGTVADREVNGDQPGGAESAEQIGPLRDQDAAPETGGGKRRRDSGETAADDENVRAIAHRRLERFMQSTNRFHRKTSV